MTLDELHALANEGGAQISRSAIGRFKRREERALQKPGTVAGAVGAYLQLKPAEREHFHSILRILDGVAE